MGIEDASIIFYPKYHPELNFIEMVWGYIKARLRLHCGYDFLTFERQLSEIIDADEIPVSFFAGCQNHCNRYMEGYRIGLEGPLLDFAVKKFSKHRSIPHESVQIVRLQYQDYALKKITK